MGMKYATLSLVLCAVIFSFVVAPQAHAAPVKTQEWLTGTQVQAILNLLRSFGVGPSLIVEVNNVLIRKKGPSILVTPVVSE